MRLLRWLGGLFGAAVLAILVTLAAARFHDGPIGPFTGGVFRSGESTPVPSDWSFATEDRTLELELPPEANRAITTWFVIVAGKLYVPCGVAARKRWPHAVLADGRVRVRLRGKVYELLAKRVDDPEILSRAAAAVAEKYDVGGDGFGSRDWIFALSAR
jgi:hypothetical protein